MTRELVLIEWIDAHSGAGGWQPLDELAKGATPLHCRSVGWIVERANETTVLAAHISGEKNENLRLFGKGEISIPDSSIVRVLRLVVPSRKATNAS